MKLKLRMLAALAGAPILVAAPLIGCSCSDKEAENVKLDEKAQAIKTKVESITTLEIAQDITEETAKTGVQNKINTEVTSDIKGEYKVNFNYDFVAPDKVKVTTVINSKDNVKIIEFTTTVTVTKTAAAGY